MLQRFYFEILFQENLVDTSTIDPLKSNMGSQTDTLRLISKVSCLAHIRSVLFSVSMDHETLFFLRIHSNRLKSFFWRTVNLRRCLLTDESLFSILHWNICYESCRLEVYRRNCPCQLVRTTAGPRLILKQTFEPPLTYFKRLIPKEMYIDLTIAKIPLAVLNSLSKIHFLYERPGIRTFYK